MAFDVEGARKAGYSDAEIADFLGAQRNFNVAGAREAGYSDEEILGHLLPPERKQSSITGELMRGIKQPFSALRTAAESVLGSPEEAARAGLQRGQEISEAAGEGPSLERLKRVYEEKGLVSAGRQALSDVPKVVAGQAGTLGTAFVGGRLGAMAGAPLGPVGALVGGGLGAAASLIPSLMGANVERQAEAQQAAGQPISPNVGKAALAATGQAALEVAGPAMALGKRTISSLLGIKPAELATDAARAKLVQEASRTLMGGAARGIAAELPVELAQTVIERAQAGLDVLSDDALKEYGETAYATGIVGGALGGAGAAHGRGAARRQLEALAPPPAPAAETPPAPEALPAPVAPTLAEMKPSDMSMAQLYQEEARLSAMLDENRKQPAIVERIKEVRALRRQGTIADIEARRADMAAREADVGKAAESAFGQEEPVQGEFREMALAPWEQRQLEQQQAQAAPEAPAPAPAETAPTGEQLELPGITPVSEIVTPEVLDQARQAAKIKRLDPVVNKWFADNVVGKSNEEVRELVKRRPDLLKKKGQQAKLLNELITKTPPPFEEAAIGRLAEPGVPAPVDVVAGGREPSVGVPAQGVRGGEERAPAPAVEEPVVRGVEPAGVPAAPRTEPEGAAPAPVAPKRGWAEMPLKPGLTPEKEQELRAQLEKYRGQIEDITDAEETARQDFAIAELTGNEKAMESAAAAQARAKLASKAVIADAVKVYSQLFDMTAAEAQAELGGQLQDQDKAEKQARVAAETAAGLNLRERRGEYPYNLKTLEAVHNELRDQLSHTPEYKKFIEENFTQDRSRVKNKKNEAKVIAEGQKLLDRMVFQTELSGNEVPLTQETINELEKGDVADALNELRQSTKNPAYAALAKRLMQLLGNTKVTIEPKLINDKGVRARGAASTSGRRIWLDRDLGLNEETLLHESVHAATEAILDKKPADRTAQQNVAIAELNKLWEAAKADANIKLSDDAQANLSEFATEALTNPKLVEQLKAKPWTISNAWEQFKKILLKMLGVQIPANMYEASVASMDTIFTAPEALRTTKAEKAAVFQLAPTVEAALKSQDVRESKTVAAAIKGAFQKMFGFPGALNNDIVGQESKIRTILADKAATVFDTLMDGVNKGMISAMESRATQAEFKQAEAADQLIPAFMRFGKLVFDKIGLWRAVELTAAEKALGRKPPSEVLPMVKAWGEKNGRNFDDAWEYAARLIESGRQYEIRKHNQNLKPGESPLPQTRNFPIDELYTAYKADNDLKAIKKVLDDARMDLIDHMVKVGRISQDTADIWKDASEYIPFDRLSTLAETFRPRKNIGRGLSALGKLPEMVKAMEVDRPVGNALNNYFSTLGWMLRQTVQTSSLNNTLAQLQKIGVATPRGTYDKIQNRSLAVRGFKNGEDYWYELPTIYHVAAFNTQAAPVMGFLKVFGAISRVLRTSITALPTFTASQLPQDIQRAIIYSGVKDPAALTARALKEFNTLMRHAVMGTLYKATPEESALGIYGDVDFRRPDPALSIAEEFGYTDRTLLGSKKAGKLLHRLNEVSRASDIAIRKAIYDQTLLETKDELLAATRAREIINFRTTGMGDPLHILPFMTQTIPFFNAYVQGLDVLYRSFTGRQAVSGLEAKAARLQFAKMAGALVAGSTLYALMMAGDDDYEEMDLRKRDRSWILGGGVALPVPSEIGILFKALPERALEAMRKYGTPDERAGMIAISSWFQAAGAEYFGRLVPVPAAVKPILESWTNYSFRTGRPLEGIYQEQIKTQERVTGTTSEFAKEVSRFIYATGIGQMLESTIGAKLSPIKIDNALNGYLGTTAALGLAMTDALMNPDKMDRPLHQMVGLTPFTYNPVGTRSLSDFYDIREKVVTAQTTLNALMKQDPARAREFAEEHREEFMLYKTVNATLKQLQNTRAFKQALNTSAFAEQMTSEERLKKKQEIEKYEQGLVSWIKMVSSSI